MGHGLSEGLYHGSSQGGRLMPPPEEALELEQLAGGSDIKVASSNRQIGAVLKPFQVDGTRTANTLFTLNESFVIILHIIQHAALL